VKADKHAPHEQHVADLLSDLRHYCDLHNVNLADCDHRARQEYLMELDEARAHA
jgi:hypothetical protein